MGPQGNAPQTKGGAPVTAYVTKDAERRGSAPRRKGIRDVKTSAEGGPVLVHEPEKKKP